MGSYAIALYGFGLIFHYIHVSVILLFSLCSCQDHYIIVDWNMELNLRNTELTVKSGSGLSDD
jgi:hypothetical protein